MCHFNMDPTQQPSINLDTDVDYSDADTWDMIASGDARGVHHIESPSMTNLLQQCNCRDIDCLTTIVAIVRPGAANQGKKDAFARRYQGFEPPSFVHPSLETVLKSTYGLMVFEEHILQVATEFAGMNLGRADVLRRALNKKNASMIAELKSEFFASAILNGRQPREIELVWPQVEGLQGFMFNKAHSAEYAVEAFQGAWLKRRWPAHYLAAILSNYRGFYASSPTLPQILYVMDALRLGIGFLPPCVNRSRERFSVEGGNSEWRMANSERAETQIDPSAAAHDAVSSQQQMIRVPVSHIKGLSQAFIDRQIAEHAKGPFDSLAEFVDRCRPSQADAQLLLNSGVLDAIGPSRQAMFWQLRKLMRQDSVKEQTLWGPNMANEETAPPVELTEPDVHEIARREMELLGFPITLDPLTFLGRDESGRDIDWARYTQVTDLNRHYGRRVTVCGLMVADRTNTTTGGDLMKFVTLGDRSGFVEAVLFPNAYNRFGHLTAAHPILLATGVVEPFENRRGFTLRVTGVEPPARRHTCA